MPYSGKLLKVEGVTLPGLRDYKVTYAKLWKDAERNMNGDVRAYLIGIFPKLELAFRNGLTEDQISTISSLLDKAFFEVEYYDPKSRGARSAQYYASDYSVELLDRKRGIFKEFSVNLIPVSRR